MSRLWKIAHYCYMKQEYKCIYKIARLIELTNYFICSCSVSAKAEIGEGTVFYHRGLGCVIHPNAKIGKRCIIF